MLGIDQQEAGWPLSLVALLTGLEQLLIVHTNISLVSDGGREAANNDQAMDNLLLYRQVKTAE